MRKNLMRVVALALCLMLLCPATLAQASGYVIGEPTRSLLAQTFLSGKRMTSELKLGMELDGEALGLTEEENAQAQAVLAALEQMTITSGVVKLEDGLRLELAGEIASEAGDATVGVNAAAQLTFDGVSVESDLIAGRRVSVKWETLLALCEVDAESIAAFTEAKEALRTMDAAQMEQMIAELVAELMETIQPIIETAGQMAQPYMQIIADAIVALPMDLRENLNEEGYPATATEISITVTLKDIGDLLTKLCDQAAQDETLKQLGDLLLAETEAGMTTMDVIDALRAEAAQMTDTTIPIIFFLGMNEEDMPMYLEAVITEPTSGESLYGGFFCYENAEDGAVLELVGGLYDAEGNATVYFYGGANALRDESDPNAMDMSLTIGAGTDEESLLSFAMTYTVMPKEGELPSYDLAYGYSMNVSDGEENVQMVANIEGSVGMTAAGGESSAVTATRDMYADGAQISIGSSAAMQLEPTADGNIAGAYSASESIPAAGVKNLTVDMKVGSETYDASVSDGLEAVELEALSEEEMEALVNGVYETLMNEKLMQLMDVLPQEVVEMLAA